MWCHGTGASVVLVLVTTTTMTTTTTTTTTLLTGTLYAQTLILVPLIVVPIIFIKKVFHHGRCKNPVSRHDNLFPGRFLHVESEFWVPETGFQAPDWKIDDLLFYTNCLLLCVFLCF